MKAIMVMFDSLNRHMLPPFGCDWTHAPNFARLARHTITFDKSYVCSMPCIPARRDLHTGRPGFLHRGWGPLEPFDDSLTELLGAQGVHSHLASDHYHYWENAGIGYHDRYSTWEFFRGQEGDAWIGQVAAPEVPANINGKGKKQDWINRPFTREEATHPQTKTFAAGLDYIERNHREDNWFLQIESFDPHEPFVSPGEYKKLYPHDYQGPLFDWPGYRPVKETPEEIEHARLGYAASLSMCDDHLGTVLHAMDRHDLWKDTMLIVWTDHGYCLAEHGCWAKNWMPLYEEVAHTPFFLWDPRFGKQGERRSSLVQPAIDLAPTLLEFFGSGPTPDMLGQSLSGVISGDVPVRKAAIFGYHGDRINVTDGRFIYYGSPVGDGAGLLNNYTLLPTTSRGKAAAEQLAGADLAPPFSFTKNMRTLRIPAKQSIAVTAQGVQASLLFDLQQDPQQKFPINDPVVEKRMREIMQQLMIACDAPEEQFQRMGLAPHLL